MRTYEVTWVMDFIADSPESAATLALQFVRASNVVLVFVVKDSKTGAEGVYDTQPTPPKRIA